MKQITKITLTVLATFFSIFLKGYVFSQLWLLIVVKTFDVQPISLASALGLSLMFSVLSIKKIDKTHKPTLDSHIKRVKATIEFLLLSYSLGYVISTFI